MTPTIHELAEQADWEMEGTRRAVERYQDAEDTADAMSLPPGKALIRGIVSPLIARITTIRDSAADTLSQGRRVQGHAWPLQEIDPKQAAVITLSCACTVATSGLSQDGTAQGAGVASSITLLAKRISGALRDQIEYEQWKAAETQRNAEAARSKVEGHKDRLKALQLTYPNLDRRVWAKWRAKLELARQGWTEAESIAVGTALVRSLVDVAPDRFLIAERPCNGGVQYFLDTTPEVREIMADVRERAEVARPLLMPMICPPIPWRYE